MGHRCPPELLDDLATVLTEVRGWDGVVEKKPGVFYVRREPFLHFHLIEGRRRRADIKAPAGWIPIDLPHPASATRRRAFLRELRRRYGERR
jgi:hypothetical protein